MGDSAGGTLPLIGADAAARDAFDGACAGRGEALDALVALLRGDADDPERNASLERHRRSAFAHPDGAADEAADRWFRSEQTAEDTYPVPFDDIDPGSTRVVHTGTDGWRVWVGRSTNSDYWLLAYTDSDGSSTSSCVAAEGFAERGGALGTGDNTVTWNGRDLTVLISRR